MLRAHKIRINPTTDQEQWLLQACGVARFCFNWGLERWRERYESGEKPSAYALKKQLNAVKQQGFPWMYNVTKCAVDTGFQNLDAAFKNFFRRCKGGATKKGYPRFKSKKHSKQSFRMGGSRIKLNDHWIKLQRLDEPINMAEALRFSGKIKSVTISKSGKRWYAAINVEIESPKHGHAKESVGIDLGVKTLAVLSDGNKFENQKPLRSEMHKLKMLNQRLSRRQKGSGRWMRAKDRLTKFHYRIANKRLDYQHKMTTKIAQTYCIIGIEDLSVSNMLKNHYLSLSISDAGFGEIRRQLGYKSEWYGGNLVKVDRFFPSSKMCRFCGRINDKLTLSDREWVCDCGAVLDRDLNAAINIETEALRIVAGVGSRRLKTHVERMLDPLGRSLTKRENMAEERQPSRLAVSLA